MGVVLFNFSETDFKVNMGDRIAQLVLEQINGGVNGCFFKKMYIFKDLEDTQRGAGGFGSTGTK